MQNSHASIQSPRYMWRFTIASSLHLRSEERRYGPLKFSPIEGLVRKSGLQVSQTSTSKVIIPGTCVQYPGLQGGGALGDASTRGTPARPMAASVHGGLYSHVAVAGGPRRSGAKPGYLTESCFCAKCVRARVQPNPEIGVNACSLAFRSGCSQSVVMHTYT